MDYREKEDVKICRGEPDRIEERRAVLGAGSSTAAVDMAERRLGRGRKAARRRWWCEDGRMRAASARRTWSPPSTAAMRTSELAIADRLACSPLDTDDAAGDWRASPLCSAQRKEPGCVVGEHAHVLLAPPPVGGAGRPWLEAAARQTDGRLLAWCDERALARLTRPGKNVADAEYEEAAAMPTAAARRVGVVDLGMESKRGAEAGLASGAGAAFRLACGQTYGHGGGAYL